MPASDGERARLAAILSGLADPVMVVAPDGELTLTNEAYDAMFGGAGADLASLGQDGRPLPLEATPRRRAARGEPFTMQFTVTGPDGKRSWYEAYGRPIPSGDGEQGGVVVIRDIAERGLQDEFLALASHELRTPLTSLDGFLQMLLRRLPEDGGDEQIRRFATTALEQARRLRVLVDDLLDATRLQSGKLSLRFERLDLVPLVRKVVERAQVLAQSQTIRLETEPGPILVQGDAGRIEQVLLNLLTNAITYAPDGERIDVRLHREDGRADIQVQDCGPGIATADPPHLFSRFYQVAPGPLGPGRAGPWPVRRQRAGDRPRWHHRCRLNSRPGRHLYRPPPTGRRRSIRLSLIGSTQSRAGLRRRWRGPKIRTEGFVRGAFIR
ncbi:MAG: PAS domain S-box protein [Chloroflexi bacterium]|nr:PAS domain S-box protein [Chloroflexota bacterium]